MKNNNLNNNNKSWIMFFIAMLFSAGIFFYLFLGGNNKGYKVEKGNAKTISKDIKKEESHSDNNSLKNFSAITEKDFKEKFLKLDNTEVLDIRTPAETSISKIFSDAKEVDFYVDFKNNINKLDKNKRYFIYCRSGSRSNGAKKTMKDLGFKEVYDLRGGIKSWRGAFNEKFYKK